MIHREDGVQWVWNSANRISFVLCEMSEVSDPLDDFYRGFRPLLLAAGAQEVAIRFHSDHLVLTPGSDSLSHDREKFSKMRRERHSVDIQFIAYDDEPDSPLLGHKFLCHTKQPSHESFL